MKKVLLFAILLLSVTCHAQTDEANRLQPFEPKNQLMQFVANVEKFAKSYPQEKVYLHLDNTGYFMEERIWFKAYVIRDYNLQHSELSKVLYVELINPSGEVVKTEKLKIVDGEADGYIDLNHLLVSGFYGKSPTRTVITKTAAWTSSVPATAFPTIVRKNRKEARR